MTLSCKMAKSLIQHSFKWNNNNNKKTCRKKVEKQEGYQVQIQRGVLPATIKQLTLCHNLWHVYQCWTDLIDLDVGSRWHGNDIMNLKEGYIIGVQRQELQSQWKQWLKWHLHWALRGSKQGCKLCLNVHIQWLWCLWIGVIFKEK